MTKKEIDHSSRGHALCSASSSERWLNCAGSVGLSLQVPEPPASPAALEGTKAHELSEVILAHWMQNDFVIEDDFLATYKKSHGDEMVDYVMDYVHGCVEEAMSFDKTPTMRIEQRLEFSKDMHMFGTADFIATGVLDGKSTGVIVDLKYGRGKKVKTEGNSQLAYYAVALRRCSRKKLEQVKVRIVQPRISGPSVSIMFSKEDLDAWDQKLTLGAEKALMMAGEMKTPEYAQGQWCWFCPAKSLCPIIQQKNHEKAVEMFST